MDMYAGNQFHTGLPVTPPHHRCARLNYDDVGSLIPRSALRFLASMLAPTGPAFLGTGIGFMRIGEGHEHVQVQHIQLYPRDESREGEVGGEQP